MEVLQHKKQVGFPKIKPYQTAFGPLFSLYIFQNMEGTSVLFLLEKTCVCFAEDLEKKNKSDPFLSTRFHELYL